MSGHDCNKFQKYICGAEKRKKKKQEKSYEKKKRESRGTFDKYVC